MPLVLPGSVLVGPPRAATPSTLNDYLVSISKRSFYARWLAGVGMFASADGSGGAVANGGAVGCWLPCEQVNFEHKFVQSTAAARPGFSLTASPLGPVVYGNGTSWRLSLSSSTALDVDCTLLCSAELLTVSTTGKVLWSHNHTLWGVQSTGVAANPYILFNNSLEQGDSLPQCRRIEGNGTSGGRLMRLAVSSGNGTDRYGSPLTLFSRITGTYFSTYRIRELAITPWLSSSECQQAITYLS